MKSVITLILFLFTISISAQKIEWANSLTTAFSDAQKENSLVMIYFYDSSNASLTELVDEKLFFNAPSDSWSPNKLVNYLNENLKAFKADITVPVYKKRFHNDGFTKYPVFVIYNPDEEIILTQQGLYDDEDQELELLSKIEKQNDSFQKASFENKGTAHYIFLKERFKTDLEEVSKDCDHINCSYPVINRLFKAVPSGKELPYLLEKALQREALDPNGPEIQWVINNPDVMEIDDAKVHEILLTSMFYDLTARKGAEINEEQFISGFKKFPSSALLNNFGKYKTSFVKFLNEEIKLMTEG